MCFLSFLFFSLCVCSFAPIDFVPLSILREENHLLALRIPQPRGILKIIYNKLIN